MKWTGWKNRTIRVVNIYEIAIWLIYAGIFKYDHYLEWRKYYAGFKPIDPGTAPYFPMPEVGLYALAMTLYIIPFYRWIVPTLLQKKKYAWIFPSLLIYFLVIPKITNWAISGIFTTLYAGSPSNQLFAGEHQFYTFTLKRIAGIDLQTIFIDIAAFLSITFMRFALENEQKKHLLEKNNLVLQLESLKAQLHPHFLFNTLNSIYGMSLTGNPDTPSFILKLSDMMRFMLYDCKHHIVPLEKDIEFLENYIAMETQRYPLADIRFETAGDPSNIQIAPLLLIPFVENSFKHGSHRVTENGFVKGRLTMEGNELRFIMENDVFTQTTQTIRTQYGGVGIENVRKRLELYYPNKHSLQITNDNRIFKVELTIDLDNS